MRHKRRRTTGEPELVNGLTKDELDELDSYNHRLSQGIVHTESYQLRMAELQRIFDQGEQMRNRGWHHASS